MFKRTGRIRLRNPTAYDPETYLPPPRPDPPVGLTGDPIAEILLGGDPPSRDHLTTPGERMQVEPAGVDQHPGGNIGEAIGGFSEGDSESEAGSGEGTADGASGDDQFEDPDVGEANSEGSGEEEVQSQEGGGGVGVEGEGQERGSSEGEEHHEGLPFDEYNHAALVGDAHVDINKVNGEFLLFVHSRFQVSDSARA